jgi:hypothetical protein
MRNFLHIGCSQCMTIWLPRRSGLHLTLGHACPPKSKHNVSSFRLREISRLEGMLQAVRRMYICQICRKTVPPHTPAHRIPVELRTRRYPRRREANLVFGKRKPVPKDGQPRKHHDPHTDEAKEEQPKRNGKPGHRPRKGVYIDDAGGEGYEIVREITACPDCAGRVPPAKTLSGRSPCGGRSAECDARRATSRRGPAPGSRYPGRRR